jgi:hypothetical protein
VSTGFQGWPGSEERIFNTLPDTQSTKGNSFGRVLVRIGLAASSRVDLWKVTILELFEASVYTLKFGNTCQSRVLERDNLSRCFSALRKLIWMFSFEISGTSNIDILLVGSKT